MKKLLGFLAAVGAVVFFWRKKQHHEDSTSWSSASDTTSSWGDSGASTPSGTADEAGTGGDESEAS